jgi:hypothetical protein
MPIFRNTIRKSRRERMRRIDHAFAILAQTLLIFYFLFFFAAWLSHRDKFQITAVSIEGVHAVDPRAVENVVTAELSRSLLWKIDRNNALLYPRYALRSEIGLVDGRVKDVETDIEGERLTIRLREYVPTFLWCPPSIDPKDESTAITATSTTSSIGCSFADETGHIFALAPEYSGSPFLIFQTTIRGIDAHAILPTDEFNKVNTFLALLAPLALIPRQVEQAGAHDFIITTDQPWVVRWSSTRDPRADVRNLALVLENLETDPANLATLKAIDLRFGNKVFYR